MKLGDQLSDFVLMGHLGEEIRLSEYSNRTGVVVFFYPKDDTPG